MASFIYLIMSMLAGIFSHGFLALCALTISGELSSVPLLIFPSLLYHRLSVQQTSDLQSIIIVGGYNASPWSQLGWFCAELVVIEG